MRKLTSQRLVFTCWLLSHEGQDIAGEADCVISDDTASDDKISAMQVLESRFTVQLFHEDPQFDIIPRRLILGKS